MELPVQVMPGETLAQQYTDIRAPVTPREQRSSLRDLDRLLAMHRQWDREDFAAGLDFTGYQTDPPSFSEFQDRLEVVFIRGDPRDNDQYEQFALQDGARIYEFEAGYGVLPRFSEGYPNEYSSDVDEQTYHTWGMDTGQFRGPLTMRAQRALREQETYGDCWGPYERQLAIATWRHRQFPCRCGPQVGCHRHFPSWYGNRAPRRPPIYLVTNRAPQARPLYRPY